MEVNHAHGVADANDPALDIVHRFLLRELGQVERLPGGERELDRLVRHHAHFVAEAELVRAIDGGADHKLAFALPDRRVHLASVRLQDHNIDIEMRAMGDGVHAVDVGAHVHILVEALLAPRAHVEVDCGRASCHCRG